MGYFSISKRRDSSSFLYSGIALMVFPYFIEGLANIVIGEALSLTSFLIPLSYQF